MQCPGPKLGPMEDWYKAEIVPDFAESTLLGSSLSTASLPEDNGCGEVDEEQQSSVLFSP